MEKLSIVELLKDCPVGMELDCTMYEDVYFDYVDELNIIHCYIQREGYKTSITFNQYGTPNSDVKSKCVIFPKGKNTWVGFQKQFEDGDVAISEAGDIHLLHTKDSSYCAYRKSWGVSAKFDSTTTTCIKVVRLATEEEKQQLFNMIKDNGYKWNPETKTLEKLVEPKFKVGDRIRHKVTNKDDVYEINRVYDDSYGLVGFTWMIHMNYQDQFELVPNKFDINTLERFVKVLVRDKITCTWEIDFWGRYCKEYTYPFFVTAGRVFAQCIPYEGNEHLYGTTNDCDDYYKTWE